MKIKENNYNFCEEPSFNTVKIRVYINKITDILAFVSLMSKCQGDVVAKHDNYAVNAKSIMGLFSLDLTKQLEIEFYGNVPSEVVEGVKKFIVN